MRYNIHLRNTEIGKTIASDFGNPVEATAFETVTGSNDPAINARMGDRENLTIWMADIERIEVLNGE